MKKRKFILPLTAFALLVSFGLAACNGGNNNNGGESQSQQQSSGQQEKITITAAEGKNKLIKGETVQLTASVAGVTWESKNAEVATVDQNGLVTAVGKGSTSISATKEGYKGGSLSITVDLPSITITGAESNATLVMEGTLQLAASEQGVTWESSDQTIATVDQTGKVTGVAPGNATISAKKDGFNAGTVSLTVTRPAALATLHFEDADHEAADGWWGTAAEGQTPVYARDSGNASDGTCIAHLDTGDKETLAFTSSAAIQAELVVMMASSSTIEDLSAIVSAKLNDTALTVPAGSFTSGSNSEFVEVSLGEANIASGDNALVLEFAGSAPYIDDLHFYSKQQATIALKAAPVKEAIEVSTPTLTINRGETAQINITKPTDLTGINFVSDNEEMASVNATGKVTGEALGEANIIVSKAGMLSVRIAVTITDQPIEGEIRKEAEDQPEGFDFESLGFHMYPDGSYIAFGHSGGAYITGYDVNSEVSLTYTIVSEKAQTMTLVIAAAPHYQMQAGEEYVFGVDATIKLNGAEVSVNEGAKVIGDGARMGAKTQNVTIGDVELRQGDNEFIIEFHGKAPALDCFKFLPKA